MSSGNLATAFYHALKAMLFIGVASFFSACSATASQSKKQNPPASSISSPNLGEIDNIPPGWGRVVLQPNGWGITRDQAIRDLDRVMRIYEKEPGFRRYDTVRIVKISKRRYQADGRCSFLAKRRIQEQSIKN